MTHVTQKRLVDIYIAICSALKAGEYERSHFKEKKMKIEKDFKKKESLSESHAHEASLDFMLYVFCATKKLKFHQEYYKSLFIPWNSSKINIDDISFNDMMEFVSPQTKKTITKR